MTASPKTAANLINTRHYPMASPTLDRTETRPTANSLLAGARELAPLLRSEAAAAQRAGPPPPAGHDALVKAGLYRLVTEEGLGGADLSLPETMRVLETIAEADGSTGWVVMA